METIKVLIADDHVLFREGLGWLFESEKDLECIGVANDGEEAIHLAKELKPDIILMDISMPKIDGIEAAKKVKIINPDTRIIILTAYKHKHYVLECMEARVDGYLLKNARRSELADTIRMVHSGKTVFSSEATNDVLYELATDRVKGGINLGHLKLHSREIDVLKLVAKGMSNKDIALELCITENTVATHLVNIFRKLGVESRVEAALFAVKEGLVKIDDAPCSEG